MNTRMLAVQHEWDAARGGEALPVVSKVIGDARAGRLPGGFDLVGLAVAKEAPKACCIWRAESRSSLEALTNEVNPPTRRSVAEFDAVHGLGEA